MKTSASVITFTSTDFHNLNTGDYVKLSNVGAANPLNNQRFYVGKLDASTVVLYTDVARTLPVFASDAYVRVSSNAEISWSTSAAVISKIITTSVTNAVYAEFPTNWSGYDYPITWINSSITVTWTNGNSTINWIRHI
jgi:hypothetical protein